jgi:hypothetical protein
VIAPGAQVEHAEFGIGKVLAIRGSTVTIDFFSEKLDANVGELVVRAGGDGPAAVPSSGQPTTDLAFRGSFEAMNLGVVPADPDQLVKAHHRRRRLRHHSRGATRRAEAGGVPHLHGLLRLREVAPPPAGESDRA